VHPARRAVGGHCGFPHHRLGVCGELYENLGGHVEVRSRHRADLGVGVHGEGLYGFTRHVPPVVGCQHDIASSHPWIGVVSERDQRGGLRARVLDHLSALVLVAEGHNCVRGSGGQVALSEPRSCVGGELIDGEQLLQYGGRQRRVPYQPKQPPLMEIRASAQQCCSSLACAGVSRRPGQDQRDLLSHE
jgi:hypothetical protein